MEEFVPFPKIARLNRHIVVTEKIDGTNAQVAISEDGTMQFGSRNRWLTVEDDNFGFARWCEEHRDGLALLGPGRHYGEWWGSGIQRRYGLTGERKCFSLFNVGRWAGMPLPSCCDLVPVLYDGPFGQAQIEGCLERLRTTGSVAAPGFMKPEGIIVFMSASRSLYKVTLEKDEEPKTAGAKVA
jgi:hypothetical protein